MSTNPTTIVTIDGHIYDVSGFLINHPGEKPQKGKTIIKYNNQDITKIFQDIHKKPSRKFAHTILENARKNREFEGIKYIGPE